ncbi:MAG: hypothetical protein K0Q50_1241 [Vampirovibrio sp.]|jgi:hypothetical protein|nr:hypothetical protein [Vampirovibrio sp.]
MQGKLTSTRMELMPQQATLLNGIGIPASTLTTAIPTQECRQQVAQENFMSRQIDSRTLDSATNMLKLYYRMPH